MPTMAIASSHDVTHCITSVGSIEEQLTLNGDFVIPEFEFKVDNIDNAEYFPSYPTCRNFMDYYDAHIRAGAKRIHIDVRLITATGNKSIFYGALDSLIPAIDYKTAELTFRATHIIKSGLADLSVERMIQKLAEYAHTKIDMGATSMLYVKGLLSLMYFGWKQSAYWDTFDVFSAEAVKYFMIDNVLQIQANNVREYTNTMDFLGDALRAFSAYYTWEDNKFSFYDIKNIWSAHAAVALDDYMTEINKSEPWEDAADDIVIEAGGNSFSSYDLTDSATTGTRPFTFGSAPTYRRTASMIRGRGKRAGAKVIDAPMLNYFFSPAIFAPPYHAGDRGYTKYASGYVSAIYFMVDMLWLHNRDFWVNHKVKLDCEVAGLNWYVGRPYTILAKNYKCIQTNKDLENETTKLKLVSAE